MGFRRTMTAVAALSFALACAKPDASPETENAAEAAVTLEETESIAAEAYIYAFPMLESYRTMYTQAINRTAPGYLAPFNEFSHESALLGPDFKDVVRPNNDTLYSLVWLDLRAQPLVITVPEIEGRYYSVQLIDMFTHNLGYIGTRATGGQPGSYVVAGPRWNGPTPAGAKAMLRSESDFVYCILRIEVRGARDVAAVSELQRSVRLTPLHVFLGHTLEPAASGITFPAYDPRRVQSAGFIDLLNFLLTWVVAPTEEDLMARFASIGIEPGLGSASINLKPETREAIEAGVGRGLVAIRRAASDPSVLEAVRVRSKDGWQAVDGLFGDGATMRRDYLARAVAAMVGLYGNDSAEAYYPIGNTDADGEALDGSTHRYMMRFEVDELPPVDAFWSMTMYGLPSQLMVPNPIDRYSVGDRTKMKRGRDGSLTIYIQRDSPGRQRESNWLPAPDGPFSLQLRMYLPKPEALEPLYLPPAVRATN